jgi:hypothetical protein
MQGLKLKRPLNIGTFCIFKPKKSVKIGQLSTYFGKESFILRHYSFTNASVIVE